MDLNFPILASTFGVAGVVANLTWPLMRNRSALLAWQVVACALMFVHFELLGAHTGALIMFVAVGYRPRLPFPLGVRLALNSSTWVR